MFSYDISNFTTEGILDAQKTPSVIAEDTLGVHETESGITLHHVKDTEPSHDVIEDEHLSWEQIMTALHNLAEVIDSLSWKFTLSNFSNFSCTFYDLLRL